MKYLNFSHNPKHLGMINKEITALKSLRHKHIVKLIRSFQLPKTQTVVILMELLSGGELTDFWNSRGRKVSEEVA